MSGLDRIHVDRCMKPSGFGEVVTCQVHHFSDASERGYGTCIYLRLRNSENKIHCSFLFGKAHAAPLKAVTIPRLELIAAVVAVKVNHMISSAIEIPIRSTVFCTTAQPCSI